MRRLLVVLAVLIALVSPLSAADPPLDPKGEALRSRLLEVLLDEAKVAERTKAVADLAALDKPGAAAALVDALEKLATRTAQVEVRAARTRQDYDRYKGAAQATDKDWAMKQRLLQQMEREDGTLRGDTAVLDAFAAAVATLKDRESVKLLDAAAVKTELVAARRVLDAGLMRNPLTNALEIAKRAAAHSDASVRLAVLQAMADRREPILVDYAIKPLTDPEWTFRQAAARALAALGDVKAIGPLVTAMASEEGRLLEDYADALSKLTGERLGPNPESWKHWYDEHKADLAARGAKPANPRLGKNPLAPPVDYYGIQTRSLKLLFLIDCSGSMNEVIGKEGVTTGDQWQGPKIEIAKKMLKAAITQLHPSTWFNVITFNTDARQFNDKLIQATPENKYTTNTKIDELVGRGGTWTYGAMKLAFGLTDPNVTPSKPPVDTIFLLSDGAPTEPTFEEAVEAAPMDPQKILASVRQWNSFRAIKIHTIAIDPRIEKTGGNFVRFMKDLAADNGGTYTAIGSR